MIKIKVPSELRLGNECISLVQKFDNLRDRYSSGEKFHLDLSNVIFMDTFGFRLVFDYLNIFTKVTPPSDSYIIELYNLWLDSKKGLSE